MNNNIQMVNLRDQYSKIKEEINKAVINCIESTSFINGPFVNQFKTSLAAYLGVDFVIPCANGTDALQIALMSLDLKPDDEVICPSFTYVATAEAVALLGLKPIMADVDSNTFNITAEIIEPLITSKTKAIVPVHLFGQSCDMEPIMGLANDHNIYVIEDNAQSIGANYTFSSGKTKKVGTLGHIGTTSFFPSKNLGCYGDGGAVVTNSESRAQKIQMIANHGQGKKYYHQIIGCNSRLDALQAAILNVKLKYLDDYLSVRNQMAEIYDQAFQHIERLEIPQRSSHTTHVFHQYTLKIKEGREELRMFLAEKGIPSMIYYPLPLYRQTAYKKYVPANFEIKNVENLCKSVISLPIHTEIETSQQGFIIERVRQFFQ